MTALDELLARTHTRNVPGHRDAGGDEWHFLNHGCTECDAHVLAAAGLGTVEDWYHTGRVGQDWFEAYMWLWTQGHPASRPARSDWTPVDDEVRRLAKEIQGARALLDTPDGEEPTR